MAELGGRVQASLILRVEVCVWGEEVGEGTHSQGFAVHHLGGSGRSDGTTLFR